MPWRISFSVGVDVVLEESDRRHDHSRCAVAALQSMALPESFLHRMKVSVAGHPFDRGDVGPIGLDGKHRA